ncbi:MAG: hypothetical protein AAB416_01105 [Patescibacteria group bacterium]
MTVDFKQLKNKLHRSAIVQRQKASASKDRTVRINATLLLTVLVVSVWYVVHVNALATKGYTIKALERKITELKSDQERLQIENIEAGSLSSIQKRIEPLRLVAGNRIDYIAVSQPVAVLR